MNREEIIEQYFSGELTQEGFAELEHLLEQNEGFKKEFYFQLEIQKTLTEEKRASLKERLAKLDRRSSPRILWYRYAAVAAGILILLGLFYYRTSDPYKKLYEANFEAYPNVVAPTVRNSGNPDDTLMAKAFNLYDNRQYGPAATAFEKLQGEDARFYQAMSLMALGDAQNAILVLEGHPWENSENYLTLSHWYLGLAYLKRKEKERARSHLEVVSEANGPMSLKAKQLLAKLD